MTEKGYILIVFYLAIIAIYFLLLGIFSYICVSREETREEEDEKGKREYMDVNRCVCCGDIIPEGSQVCPNCRIEGKGRKADERERSTDRFV